MWKRNIPNILSVIRLLMIPVFVYVFLSDINDKTIIAFGIFVLAWLTDALDGYLARKYNWITDLGKILDPIADKLMQLVAVICLVIVKRLSVFVISVVFFKELIMAIGAIIVTKKKKSVAASRWYGKLTTILLFVAFAILIVIEVPNNTLVVAMNSVIVIAELFALIMYALYFINIFREKGQ